MAPKIGWTDVKGLKINADLQESKQRILKDAKQKELAYHVLIISYLANFIIESVYHQVADSLRAGGVGKVGGIFWSCSSAIELN